MHRASLWISLIVLLGSFAAFADDAVPLVNWTVPGISASSHRLQPRATADLSGPNVFVPVTPCRVVDTRWANGAFGGPIFNAGETRSYTVPSSSCSGIPGGSVSAVSLNITVTQTGAGGFLTAWPAGASQPGVGNLTWFAASQTLTNASVVPTSSSGAISVFVGMANGTQTHVIIDINGYFLGDGGNGGDSLNSGEHLALTGTIDSAAVIRGWNLSTFSSSNTSGVKGLISGGADLSSGVLGISTGGLNFGVSGINNDGSDGAAGVLGVMNSRPFVNFGTHNAGIRGENTEGFGVLGITSSTLTPIGGGVFGHLIDSNGDSLASGGLGLRASTSLVYGVFSNGNTGATGTKSFVEPHPTDASKVIRYVSLEGPEAGTYFRGRGKFHDGSAVIDVPESFRMVTDTEGLTVQITPIGAELTTANVVTASLNQIAVRSNHDVEFFYLVQGVRKAYKDWQPIAEGFEFVPRSPSDRIPAYLSEEAKQRLIQNGTYNADGSVNMATAAREGWTKAWARLDARAQTKVTRPEDQE